MFELRSERVLAHSPRAFPWEQDLPWALARLRQTIAAGPERADRASESACVKGAGVGTEHGTGTSATAKIRSACGAFVAGRQRGARPNVARIVMSEPSTPKQRRIAAAEPNLCPRPLKTPNLHPRVVTRPNFVFRFRSAIGQGATKPPKNRSATEPAIAAPSVVKPSVMSKTVNASGSLAAP